MEDIYFDDFIGTELYGSQGYYKSSLTINEKNDFITSPNISISLETLLVNLLQKKYIINLIKKVQCH